MKISGHLDLFSGIGGFALGLEQAGVEPEWTGFSDIDKYANELFKRRFPDAEELGTVTDVSYKSLGGRRIDLLTGGFPCQTFSVGFHSPTILALVFSIIFSPLLFFFNIRNLYEI